MYVPIFILFIYFIKLLQVFEGIAVGLQTQLSQCINLVVAVALHKWAEALTLVCL